MTGTAFAQSLKNVDRFERELRIEQALLTGNIPDYMHEFVDVHVIADDKNGQKRDLTLRVLPDYLTIGTTDDRIRMPMFPMTAQRIADAWNCILPTPKMVDIFWKQATNKLAPMPWGPPYDSSMMSNDRLIKQNEKIESFIKKNKIDCSKLTAGHYKDVVISVQMNTNHDHVGIYGWHQLNGDPIQGLNFHSHELTYADYSHSVRLTSINCELNDQPYDLRKILQDPALCHLVSSEGPLTVLQYPTS